MLEWDNGDKYRVVMAGGVVTSKEKVYGAEAQDKPESDGATDGTTGSASDGTFEFTFDNGNKYEGGHKGSQPHGKQSAAASTDQARAASIRQPLESGPPSGSSLYPECTLRNCEWRRMQL